MRRLSAMYDLGLFDRRLPTSYSITFLSKLGVFAVLSHRNLGNVLKLSGFIALVAGLACLLAPLTVQAQIDVTSGTLTLNAPVPGLVEGVISGTSGNDILDPLTPTSVQTVARWGASSAVNAVAGPPDMDGTSANTLQWTNNTTLGYTGLIDNTSNAPVTYTFRQEFRRQHLLDDRLASVVNNTAWNLNVIGQVTLSPGSHTIDLRFGQGGGGAGPIPVRTTTLAFPTTPSATRPRPAPGCRWALPVRTPPSTPACSARRRHGIRRSRSPAAQR